MRAVSPPSPPHTESSARTRGCREKATAAEGDSVGLLRALIDDVAVKLKVSLRGAGASRELDAKVRP